MTYGELQNIYTSKNISIKKLDFSKINDFYKIKEVKKFAIEYIKDLFNIKDNNFSIDFKSSKSLYRYKKNNSQNMNNIYFKVDCTLDKLNVKLQFVCTDSVCSLYGKNIIRLTKNILDKEVTYDNTITILLLDLIKKEDFKAVKLLIDMGADVNAKDENDRTALIYASRNSSSEILEYLIEKGADVNAKDDENKTALIDAASFNNLEVIKYLIEKGADINAKDNENKTVLMHAAFFADLEIIEYLVYKGADINAKDIFDKTALMYAASFNNLEVVEYFIEKGLDINTKDNKNKTALSYALEKGNTDMVKLLKFHGAE